MAEDSRYTRYDNRILEIDQDIIITMPCSQGRCTTVFLRQFELLNI